MYKITWMALLCLSFYQCRTSRPSEGSYTGHIEASVYPSVETDPVPRGKEKDSADDPAIWINKKDVSKSVIFGSDKKGGIAAYALNGKQREYYRVGKINNIDVRYALEVNGKTFDVLGGSNRSENSVDLWLIDEQGMLVEEKLATIKSNLLDGVYGFCLHKDAKGSLHAFVNSKLGEVEQYVLLTDNGVSSLNLVRTFQAHCQTEGMVVDDQNETLYVGKERAGIWKFGTQAHKADTLGVFIPKSDSASNLNIVYDIEGLAIYKTSANTGYLLASVQGNYSYAVFTLEAPHRYLMSFRINTGNGIDAVEETDGIEIYNQALPGFPHGVLIVQDGFNYNAKGEKKAQNFKLIDWQQIEALLENR